MIQAPYSKVKIFDSLPLVPVSFKLGLSPSTQPLSGMGASLAWDLLRLLSSQRETWFCNTVSGSLVNSQPKELRFSKALGVSSPRRFLSTATSRLLRAQCVMALHCGPRMCSQHLLLLRCIGEVRAGEMSETALRNGEAMQIMTGAPVPEGANAVVMVENTDRRSDGQVQVLKPVKAGENIAPKGSERRAGDTVLRPGRRISTLEASVLATTGKAEVLVYRRPVVAILATGDELVAVEEVPKGRTNSQLQFVFALWAGAEERCHPLDIGNG